jgi:hypothetical protein
LYLLMRRKREGKEGGGWEPKENKKKGKLRKGK